MSPAKGRGGRNRSMEAAFKAAGYKKTSKAPPEKPGTNKASKSGNASSGKASQKKRARTKPKANAANKRLKQRHTKDNPLTISVPGSEVYRGKDGAKNTNEPPPKTIPEKVVVNEQTTVNPALVERVTVRRARSDIAGTSKEQCHRNPDGYAELVLGLDFGTANTKVVIMEQGSQQAWAVEFTQDEENPYLLPSTVYSGEAGYSLVSGEKIPGLKLPLLLGETPSDQHEVHVVAFLALVIRFARAWFFENCSNFFPDAEFDWHYRIGLPSTNYKDKGLVERYKNLLVSAAHTSMSPSNDISAAMTSSSLRLVKDIVARRAGNDPLRVSMDSTDVFPEIAAQLHGYVMSDRWDPDRSQFMLVDIGGGTVDASILNVVKDPDGRPQYTFLRSSVQSMGVVMLHRDRMRWIESCVEAAGCSWPKIRSGLETITFSKDNTRVLPKSVRDYLVNAKFPPEKLSSDQRFYNAYGSNLWTETIKPVKGRIIPSSASGRPLLFLLCGGGSMHPLFKKFIPVMKSQKKTNGVALDPVRLAKPQDMHCPACPAREYHRLSVAYGLAHWELGEIIRESNIDEAGVVEFKRSYTDSYVSKDQM